MAIQPTDTLNSLTNAQCGQLRDELVVLLIQSGIGEPTIRSLKRRLRIGIDNIEDKKDEQAEHAVIETGNQQRRIEAEAMKLIRDRRITRRKIDYGDD